MRRLSLIVKPYSASEMFVTHNLRERLSHRLVYLPSYLPLLQSDNGGDQYCIHFNIFFFCIVFIICILNICILYMNVCLK